MTISGNAAGNRLRVLTAATLRGNPVVIREEQTALQSAPRRDAAARGRAPQEVGPGLRPLYRGPATAASSPATGSPRSYSTSSLYCLHIGVPQRPADGLAGRRAGLRARSEREWVRQLERLVGDPRLRRRLGEAGRRLAETSFDHHQHLLRLGRFLCAPEGEGT